MTIAGYVPAIGETDLDKIIRSIRNIYENGAAASDITSSGPSGYQISTAVAGNALTVSLLNSVGATPSAGAPVPLSWRDSTLANGDSVSLSITSALTVTLAAGNTMGTVNSVPFRLWVVGFYNGGSPQLGLINCLVGGATPSRIASISTNILQSSSTSSSNLAAAVFATTSAISNSPVCILGFVEYPSGLAAAGTWSSAPTEIQLLGSGVKLPGDIVQTVFAQDSAVHSTTANNFAAGATFISQAITPTSKANAVMVDIRGCAGVLTGTGGVAAAQIFNGSNALGQICQIYNSAGLVEVGLVMQCLDYPQSTSAVTYNGKLHSDGTNTASLGIAVGYGSTAALQEIMS